MPTWTIWPLLSSEVVVRRQNRHKRTHDYADNCLCHVMTTSRWISPGKEIKG
jgi:hypothetical protein